MKQLGRLICLVAVLLLGAHNALADCGHGTPTPCAQCCEEKVIKPNKNRARNTAKAQRITPTNPLGLVDVLETVLSNVRFFRLY